eukprot:TRINITY_DN12929_c0_g1_i1.p1 TRINITY_DN12929_c0_g1~~TRINITY_DN12929_c0_g1_i1.p1  ORF type:complete len:155 (+),score=36.88 TRINITY_DN12929_c0_g1_i1:46-510(+)
MKNSSNRLLNEYKIIMKENDDEISIYPIGDNLNKWIAKITGPPETPYEEGIFEIELDIPKNYPLSAPKAYFKTKIFHPNILWKTGEICLDILKDSWTAGITIPIICRSIRLLMSTPEESSPLNCDCGNLLRCGDKMGYESLARFYTIKYAKNSN